MSTLTKANEELFRRTPDECFDTLDELHTHCRGQRENSQDYWERPEQLLLTHDMTLGIGDDANFTLNDWSFSQLCRMANVSKETINRLSTKTASKAFEETLPRSEKPLQLLATGNTIRSVHGVAFTRLNYDDTPFKGSDFWNGHYSCAMGVWANSNSDRDFCQIH